ncbi:hypothetical protein [Secundilactobacillus paracollinoides]|uniref:hypothetical protein n=1 Tax=Secundilactobacillus paracollinoides TaxID=240427 RepID=UPI00081A9F42|nr:hypothetical protein [Secundilactobacillus paracollinoides]ANZ62263.1 hypothetical protein AYR61_13540 [Secundilactobacillus paracollinoides]
MYTGHPSLKQVIETYAELHRASHTLFRPGHQIDTILNIHNPLDRYRPIELRNEQMLRATSYENKIGDVTLKLIYEETPLTAYLSYTIKHARLHFKHFVGYVGNEQYPLESFIKVIGVQLPKLMVPKKNRVIFPAFFV